MAMESRKPAQQNLAETLHSLLGLKARLTSAWVKSVCDIIKSLPSQGSPTDIKSTNFETKDCFNNIVIDGDSDTAISQIKDELAILFTQISQLNIQRRQVLNDFLDLKGNIRVLCRIRPIGMGENFGRLRPVVALDSNNIILKLADNKSKNYSFDKVFHPGSSQDEVFSEIEPVIKSVLDGYNACIFAYGQTGTGKTYTMEGNSESPGVVPRAIEALLKQAVESNHAFLISFSMLEIYLGNLKDLLVPHPIKPTDPMPPCLSIQMDPKGGIEIDNLVAIRVSDFNQALKLYRLGRRFRSTASTNSNITSSRSHCMIRISITCFNAPERRRETNKIWLVDLGGSERLLKTNAWGRRLDEGKAINLSLSALGDVINALQRKKHHIPYRNSKLTQVLKDSLGEDSKTLMLVHVSPKEEDLCETICSLNFATRVKSVHLGSEQSIEAQNQKAEAMANLQQKMNKIEDEREHVRRDIKTLNDKLETLTKTTVSEGNLEASHLSVEESISNLEVTKKRIEEVTAAPISRLPRFMRPTVCSIRKSGIDHRGSEAKDQIHARRRRPSSHCAESVTLPVKKDSSEYNSGRSISRASCLVGLNMKSSVDNETEYSQDLCECDIKMAVPEEHVKAPSTSVHQTAHFSHIEKYENGKTTKTITSKFLKVDNWLHLHKNESTISGHRNKQVLATPTAEKEQKCNRKSKAEKMVDIREVGRTISEMVFINKPPAMLKDLFEEDSRSDSSSPSHTITDQSTIQTRDSVDGSSIEDNNCGSHSPTDEFCGRLHQYKDADGVVVMPIMQEEKGQTQRFDGFTLKNNGYYSFSLSDGSLTAPKEDYGIATATLERETICQQAHPEKDTENCERKNKNSSLQLSEKGSGPDLLQRKSKRALFMDNANQKDLSVPVVKSEGNSQNTGICHALKEKLQIFCASALLGLGFYDLGLGHDFFYGLIL